ncbi:Clavaminate synthase-like protein [Mytilinidion resinicola]|uniref:Clavaminate synthase-like protein n=1 Tax=Mytilinidion resinicola TaxID=574789 RepID=A0A6A6YJA7_9PEZI|nr:Clavaminate synthase-like protein [Mytilinidion resinicola]KAF2808638.1 Clavaminate synthase-like protein [Mytilinidion resinicola]
MSINLLTRAGLRPLTAIARAGSRKYRPGLSARNVVPARQFWKNSTSPAQEATTPQEHLVHDASNAGQFDGKSSKNLAVSIDGEPKIFDSIFLRDSCTCPECVDPSNKQKLFQTCDIPENIEGVCQTIVDKEHGWMVEVAWQSDVPGYSSEHRTKHSINWLKRALTTEVELRGGVRSDERVVWNKEIMTKNNKWLDYDDYMANDHTLFEALVHLNKYGLLFFKGVPDSEKSVEDIAERIGTLKDSFYGRTWDVKSIPNAKNIAYTSQFLGLHMDLLYTANPPHLQFLHSLRAQSPGGSSLFADTFYAAAEIHTSSAFHFRTLCTFPVTYHYHNDSQHYHYTRPTIELFPYPKYSEPTNLAIRRVNWSPPFQGPFEARIGGENQSALSNYLSASKAFEKALSSEENMLEYRLKEGECVVFDNRRVVHARRAFDADEGERWLKGAYVDDDVFFSRLRVLQEKFEGKWVSDGVTREAVK